MVVEPLSYSLSAHVHSVLQLVALERQNRLQLVLGNYRTSDRPDYPGGIRTLPRNRSGQILVVMLWLAGLEIYSP